MRFPSKTAPAVLAVTALPLLWGLSRAPVPPSGVAAADIVLVREGDVVREDLYAVGSRVIVEGTVAGDLMVAAGDLRLTGTVEGDVVGVARTALVAGEVGGSVRLAAVEVRTEGRIGDDLAVVAGNLDATGGVGRDLLVAASTLRMRGGVERDLRGWLGVVELDGRVDRNVEVAVQRLTVGSGTVVAGDLVYTGPQEGRISAAAEVGGNLVRREPAPANVRVRAGQRLGALLAFFAFVTTGFLLLLVSPGAAGAAVVTALERPGRSWLVGLGAVLAVPIVAALAVGTVVGLPVALALMGLWTFGLVAGPVPALAAVGHRILGVRVSPYGAFLLGAFLWGLVLLLPLVGGIAYLLALFWGAGAWLAGMWAARGELTPTGRNAQPEREESPPDADADERAGAPS